MIENSKCQIVKKNTAFLIYLESFFSFFRVFEEL
jgi:hypothetical protein